MAQIGFIHISNIVSETEAMFDVYFQITPLQVLLLTLIMTLGAALQGSAGYGMALLVSPILLLIAPTLIPGPLISAAFFLTILMLIREKQSIDFKGLQWASIGMIIGVTVGTLLLYRISTELVSIVFAISILFAVLISISGFKFKPEPWVVLLAAIIAGFMGIITTTAGPPLAIVYQESEGGHLRSMIGGVFIIGSIASFISLAIIGRFGVNEFLHSLILYPGILLGYLVSNKVIRNFDNAVIRPLVLGISALSGIVILIRQLLQ